MSELETSAAEEAAVPTIYWSGEVTLVDGQTQVVDTTFPDSDEVLVLVFRLAADTILFRLLVGECLNNFETEVEIGAGYELELTAAVGGLRPAWLDELGQTTLFLTPDAPAVLALELRMVPAAA